jgi:DNA-binding CsgD family transcriptional regulator
MLAATLGERARAEAHFERAMTMNREMGASGWLAHTAYQYGRFLLGERDRRERAGPYLDQAASLAGALGMSGLAARVQALGADGAGVSAPELPAGLSPREAQILALVARGMSNREIGDRLSISEHTVANHVRAILRKTESANRTEATSFAHRHGLASA